MADLGIREMVVLIPIVVFMFWLGVQPGLVLDRLELSIEKVMAPLSIEQIEHHALKTDESLTDTPVMVTRDTEGQK